MFTFRVRVRMGIHSGPCGTAVSVKYIWKPYYFVYGHAIEIAKLMGACSEPMKIQVPDVVGGGIHATSSYDMSTIVLSLLLNLPTFPQVSKVTIDILDHSGGPFNYLPRDAAERPPGIHDDH